MYQLPVAECLCILLCAAAVSYVRGQHENKATVSVQSSILLKKHHHSSKATSFDVVENPLLLHRHRPDISKASYRGNGTTMHGGLPEICDHPKVESINELKQRFHLEELDTGRTVRNREQWRTAGRSILGDLLNKAKEGIESTIGTVAKGAVVVGKMVVHIPVQGMEKAVNTASALSMLGVGTVAKIMSDTADWAQGNLKAVKAIDFPGKGLLVMMYPKGLVTVIDKTTNGMVYILDATHRTLKSAFAYTLYISLKIVAGAVTTIVKAKECIKLSKKAINMNETLISKIVASGGHICGIHSMTPVNNVTITKNDDKFLIVETPWTITNLVVRFGKVKVIGLGGTLVDNEPMNISIKKIKLTATVMFEAGTILRFIRIHLELDKILGLKIKFTNPKKSYLMEAVEGLADATSEIVKDQINVVLQKIEDKVFDYIANV